APLGAVIIAPHVVAAFAHGSGTFQHGFTYQAHPVSVAAGNAVLDYLESQKLFTRVAPAGALLRRQLQAVAGHRNVGEVRGLGLLLAIEFIRDKETRQPFASEENIAERIRQA